MLWRNFQLAAYMVFTQFPEECVIGIRKYIVKPDARTDKYFLHSGQVLKLPKQLYIILMICIQVPARFRKEALSVLTYAPL